MDYIALDESKLKRLAELSGCSINFSETKDKDWVRGFVVDNSSGSSIGRITIKSGSFSHIKWYTNSYNPILDMLLNEISANINEANKAISELQQRDYELDLIRQKISDKEEKQEYLGQLH